MGFDVGEGDSICGLSCLSLDSMRLIYSSERKGLISKHARRSTKGEMTGGRYLYYTLSLVSKSTGLARAVVVASGDRGGG